MAKKRLRIGDLRHRLAVYRPDRTEDAIGGKVRADTLVGTYWGHVAPASAWQQSQADRPEDRITHMVYMRNQATNPESGWRIVHRERDFYVKTVRNPDERDRFLTLECREGGPR